MNKLLSFCACTLLLFLLSVSFISLLTESSIAETYQYSVIPIKAGATEQRALDFTNSGYVLFTEKASGSWCPILYQTKTKRAIRLCAYGLGSAHAVNESGEVLSLIHI